MDVRQYHIPDVARQPEATEAWTSEVLASELTSDTTQLVGVLHLDEIPKPSDGITKPANLNVSLSVLREAPTRL